MGPRGAGAIQSSALSQLIKGTLSVLLSHGKEGPESPEIPRLPGLFRARGSPLRSGYTRDAGDLRRTNWVMRKSGWEEAPGGECTRGMCCTYGRERRAGR